jgi:hypothetical protein
MGLETVDGRPWTEEGSTAQGGDYAKGGEKSNIPFYLTKPTISHMPCF